MFDFSKWLTAGILDGYKKQHTPFARVTELTAAYLAKGFISQAQAAEIAAACPAPTANNADELCTDDAVPREADAV